MGQTSLWIQVIAWSGIVVGVVIVLLALFIDRARGRRRCPTCRYSMENAAPGESGRYTCPECGTVARRARDLVRTRRHWFAALLGVLIGLAAWKTPDVVEHGPIAAVPTWVLVAGPFGGEREWWTLEGWYDSTVTHRVAREIARRQALERPPNAALSYWARRVERALRDDARARITPEMVTWYDRLHARTIEDDLRGLNRDEVLRRIAENADVPLSDVVPPADSMAGLVMDRDLRGRTCAAALRDLPWSWGDWRLEPDGLGLRTRPGPRGGVVRRYAVQPILDAQARLRPDARPDELGYQLFDTLEELIEPDRWLVNGGDDAVLVGIGDSVLVEGSARIHLPLAALLASLEAVVTTPPAASVRATDVDPPPLVPTRIYDTRDLVRRLRDIEFVDVKPEWFIHARVVDLVEPDTWVDMGGETGTTHFVADVMICQTRDDLHGQVQAVLDEMLRRAQAGEPLITAEEMAEREPW